MQLDSVLVCSRALVYSPSRPVVYCASRAGMWLASVLALSVLASVLPPSRAGMCD